MNLLEIRTAYVNRFGRQDLVVDITNYADNGADLFIQAANKYLESKYETPNSMGKYVTTLQANQASVYLKYLRYVEALWIKRDGSERVSLDRKTYSWIVEEYGEDFGEKAVGTITLSDVPTANDTITIDTEVYTFKASASASTEISIGATASATIDNIVTALNTNSSICSAQKGSTTILYVTYYLIGTAGNSIVFTESADNLTMDGSGTLGSTLAGRANLISTGTPSFWAPLVSLPSPELTYDKLGTAETHHLLFGIDRFSKDGIVICPPTDVTTTLTIEGGFFAKFTADGDVTYWSERYAEILLQATNLIAEFFMRNMQGSRDMYDALNILSDPIDKDLVRAEMVLSGNTMRG